MWMRSCAIVGLSMLCVAAIDVRLVVGDDSSSSDLARTPVEYASTIIAVVNSDGVALIRFTDPEERANKTGNGLIRVSYQWRYLARRKTIDEDTGSGRLFAKLSDGKFNHGDREIVAGPISLQWRQVDNKRCDVLFDPTQVAVHPLEMGFFEIDPDGGEHQYVVELARFLFPDEKNASEHRANDLEYEGPESETHRYAGDVAGKVEYDTVLIVRERVGIATYRFGKSFDREIDDTFKHHGVPYEYTLTSFDGTVVATGKDEVFERYRDNTYDNGRLHLQAGDVHLQWSAGGSESGWVYYDPTWSSVWKVHPDDAQKVIDGIVAARN